MSTTVTIRFQSDFLFASTKLILPGNDYSRYGAQPRNSGTPECFLHTVDHNRSDTLQITFIPIHYNHGTDIINRIMIAAGCT